MRKKISLVNSKGSMTFKEGFNQFVYVKRVLNMSEATVKHYNGTYNRFICFFDKDELCSKITIETIYGFIQFLKDSNPNIKIKSINSYLADLRAIINYFSEEGIMTPFKVPLLKDEVKIKETYTDDELERLLEKPDLKRGVYQLPCLIVLMSQYIHLKFSLFLCRLFSRALLVHL